MQSKNSVYVIMDGRFTSTSKKPSSNHLHYERFAKRYTSVFDHVYIIARVSKHEDKNARPIAGPGVKVIPLPHKESFFSLPKAIIKILHILCKTDEKSVFILRVPGLFPSISWFLLFIFRKKYGVETVADPADLFSKGSSHKPLRPVIKNVFVQLTKLQCFYAHSASYVTKAALQKKYPSKNAKTFSYTSLDLTEDVFTNKKRTIDSYTKKEFNLINVAMMQKKIKGQDILLQAFSMLCNDPFLKDFKLSLTLIGDGDNHIFFKELAKELSIQNKITFKGKISDRKLIYKELDNADIFLLPSRQEGLPRAMLEAMARGLPCIGSNVGGISELIPEKFILQHNTPEHLYANIKEIINSPKVLYNSSERNIKKAKEYSYKKIKKQRDKFYKSLST